jgi:hypothetical protein
MATKMHEKMSQKEIMEEENSNFLLNSQSFEVCEGFHLFWHFDKF